MLDELRRQVLEVNLELAARALAHSNFGNVSAVDRDEGLVAIKPSGVPYEDLRHEDIAVVGLVDGEHLEGLRPSSDTPMHLAIYRAFGAVGGIAHTHSPWATSWAQARRPIPCLGTTHADSFRGPVPCTRPLSEAECGDCYERATGFVIIETFEDLDPQSIPRVLIASHGPVTWGESPEVALDNATALEEVAQIAFNSLALRPELEPISRALRERHFLRKHGPSAYYGQVDSDAAR